MEQSIQAHDERCGAGGRESHPGPTPTAESTNTPESAQEQPPYRGFKLALSSALVASLALTSLQDSELLTSPPWGSSSLLARWLTVAVQHPFRTPLAILLLATALLPERSRASRGASRLARSQL